MGETAVRKPVVVPQHSTNPSLGRYGKCPRGAAWDRLSNAEAARRIVKLWKRRDYRLFGPG